MNIKEKAIEREVFDATMKSYNDFINSAVCGLWEAFRETVNKPFRHLTPAERKINDDFRRYVTSISVSKDSITYKTIAGDFTTELWQEEV